MFRSSLPRLLGALAVKLLVSAATLAQPVGPLYPDAPFPGARTPAAVVRGEEPATLLRALYGVRGANRIADANACGRTPCSLRLVASEAWAEEDGREMMLLVGAAEPREAAHATGAVLGIALLARTGTGWQLRAGSPAVDVIGAWGEAPPVGFVLAGGFGRGVVASPEVTGQGVSLASWHLYLPVGGKIRKVLQLEAAQESIAACARNDTACRRRADEQDFTSTVETEPAADGGVDVAQAITPASPAGPPAMIRRWHIAPDGRVTQVGGRNR